MPLGGREGKVALAENHCLNVVRFQGRCIDRNNRRCHLHVGLRAVGLVTGNLSWRTEAGTPTELHFEAGEEGFSGPFTPSLPTFPPLSIPPQLTAQKHKNSKSGFGMEASSAWGSLPLPAVHLEPAADGSVGLCEQDFRKACHGHLRAG